MSMTVLLPPLLLGVLILVCLGSMDVSRGRGTPWQGAFLLAVTFCGAYLVLLTEGLSLFNGLSRWPIAAGWLVGFAVVCTYGVRAGNLRSGIQTVVSGLRSLSRRETGLLVSILILSATLFAVAVVTPTNNVDAMDYHMPRVLEWAQNGTLAHFPTMHESQNVRPYWAEAVILHLRVLWGNDQPAGLAQWSLMLASVIAASGIAALLGGERRAQWLTAVIAFSIPMGLLQSATTQNDYASAFWVVCLGYFVILSRKRELDRSEFFGLGLALSLGMLTKGTFFPFAGPLMAWFFIGRLQDGKWKWAILQGIALTAIVVAGNGLFWARNIQSTGGPYGSGNPFNLIFRLLPFRSEVLDAPSLSDSVPSNSIGVEGEAINAGAGGSSGPTGMSLMGTGLPAQAPPRLSQLARMTAMNFVSPFSAFNQAYFRVLRRLPLFFPEAWIRNLEGAAWNHEDSAGSPIHFVLILLSLTALSYASVRGRFRLGLTYAIVLISSFTLLSLIGFSDHIFGIRYQLAFFVIGTPLVGLVFSRWNRLGLLLAVLLLIYAVPYVLLSNMRPVIGHRPWPTRVESVFVAPKDELLFAINPGSEEGLDSISEQIQSAGCTEVGLSYSRNNLEYQIWYLLGAPQSGVTIRNLVSLPAFAPGLDESFNPCAVVCTACDALPDEYLLPLSFDYGAVRLDLQSDTR
jgi:4-amino-4-deoxy-L-arabinose transferase-like glycosyltransferase